MDMTQRPEPDGQEPSAGALVARVGSMLTRDTAIYGLAMMAVFPFSLIQVAVLTRYLLPSAYGQLAVVLFFSGLLTILMNLVTFQGTMIVTYGISGDDGDDGGGGDVGDMGFDDSLESADAVVRDKQLALSTGVFTTVAIAVVISVPIVVFAGTVSKILLHSSEHAEWVRLAVAAAFAGAMYRFASNVLRMERRPWKFAAASVLRPAAVIGLALYLVATGHGVTGVLVATAAGSAIVSVLCWLNARRSFRLGFSVRYMRMIFGRGLPIGWMHLCMYFVHTADVFLLSRFAPTTEVGLYRVASRFGSIPSYFSSAYTMALPPLEKTTVFQAAYQDEGTRRLKSRIFSWYVAIALGLVVALSIAADLLVLLAAPSYHDAAQLIPLVSLAMVMYGSFTVILRASKIPRPIPTRVGLVSLAAVLMTGFSMVLIPWLGSYGVALATLLAMSVVNGTLLYLGGRAEDPFRVQWWRVLRIFAAAAAAWAVGTRLAGHAGDFHAVLGVLGMILYPTLLVALGAVPRDRFLLIAEIARTVLPGPRRRRALLERVQLLPPRRRAVLEAIARDGKPIEQVAMEECISTEQVSLRLVRGLCHLGRVEAPEDAGEPVIVRIADYLLMPGPTVARDDMARRLLADGMDAYALDRIEATFTTLSGASSRSWRQAAEGPSLLAGGDDAFALDGSIGRDEGAQRSWGGAAAG